MDDLALLIEQLKTIFRSTEYFRSSFTVQYMFIFAKYFQNTVPSLQKVGITDSFMRRCTVENTLCEILHSTVFCIFKTSE